MGALLKALFTFIFVGIMMRAVRALMGGGAKGHSSETSGEEYPGRREGARPGPAEGASKPPVRREDIIDVPYEDS